MDVDNLDVDQGADCLAKDVDAPDEDLVCVDDPVLLADGAVCQDVDQDGPGVDSLGVDLVC